MTLVFFVRLKLTLGTYGAREVFPALMFFHESANKFAVENLFDVHWTKNRWLGVAVTTDANVSS